MNRRCDLHTHSVFSDGTFTPTEIVEKAVSMGLSAVALTDHNTIDGLGEFLNAAKGKDIEVVPGAEFSVDYKGTELHLLGLFIPESAFPKISGLMAEFNARKEKSNIDLVAALNRDGYAIDYSEIRAKSPKGTINRAHIAAELLQKGYVESIGQAFERLLSKTGGYYVEPKRLTVWEMIDVINEIGAVPVLAHPFLNLSEEELSEFLPLAKEKGLKGIECYYSSYDEKLLRKSLDFADSLGLKKSGGSDFHGENKPNISLGTGKGDLFVPFECFEKLKK